MKRTRFGGRKLMASLMALSATLFGLVALTPSANASPLYCGESTLIHQITVSKWGEGQFQIHVTPTGRSRFSLDPQADVNTMWHAVQACVPGLYGDLADTIYQQLECHENYALLPGGKEGSFFRTGDTYDLESWRPKLTGWDIPIQEVRSACLNNLSTRPGGGDPAGPFGDPIRPDLGQTDLSGAYSAVG